MSLIFYIFIFLFGLIIGSFLNCVIYRIETGQSFIGGRSYCPRCKRKLGFSDLIPVLSLIWLKGKCRYCKEKISWQYPIVEIATGSLFVLNFLRFDLLGRSNLLISGFGAAAFFLAIVLVSRGRWMGVGDIKLAFLMGLVLGYPNILAALFLAFLIGAIMGVGLIIFGKKTMKSEVPFGPFLIGGTFAALFWGEKIISWYVQSFHIN